MPWSVVDQIVLELARSLATAAALWGSPAPKCGDCRVSCPQCPECPSCDCKPSFACPSGEAFACPTAGAGESGWREGFTSGVLVGVLLAALVSVGVLRRAFAPQLSAPAVSAEPVPLVQPKGFDALEDDDKVLERALAQQARFKKR